MKKIALLLSLLVTTQFVNAQTQLWKLDKSHSDVSFGIDHMVISETKGKFDSYTMDVKADKADFSDATVTLNIDVNSINTNDAGRDGHLKGEDFFNTAKNPEMKFVSTGLKKVKGNIYKLTGNLTMNGVTKPVTLNAKFNGIVKSPFGDTRAGLIVSGEIDRYVFGLKYNSKLENGGLAIGQKVRINCSVELIKG